MLLYRTEIGPVLHAGEYWVRVERTWDALVNDDFAGEFLAAQANSTRHDADLEAGIRDKLLAPIGTQELWAAGVTYQRSRAARKNESQSAGGGDFYDRVYAAERPEIFFKATAQRVVGPGRVMHLRRDSQWIVPEPELTLVVTRTGKIMGYTIGNDLSCRDIEGENPLYLPQAKTFDRCAALGPAVWVSEQPPPADTHIRLVIERSGTVVVEDATKLAQMKRSLSELVSFLFRDTSHPAGVLLLTGTGIVPRDEFTLQAGDQIKIAIDGIGVLTNSVE